MGATVIPTRFQLRRDTAANWTAKNPTPLAGEPCLETDTGLRKLGDGATAWTSLLYQLSGAAYNFGALADGDTPIWDGTNKRWNHGPGGKVYQAGTGIAIDDPSTSTPTIRSTVGAISLSGYATTYAGLPTGLGSGDAGKAYLCAVDGLVYVWSGSAFPASGAGLQVGWPQVDPYASNVVSLLRMTGANGGTTFTDDVTGRTWTNHGVTTVTTLAGPFATSCAYFNGSSYLVSDTSTDFGFGSGDFTAEAFVAQTGSGTGTLCDIRTVSNQGFGLYANDSVSSWNVPDYANNSTQVFRSRISIRGSLTWQHIAICRSAGNVTMFLDGQVVGYGADTRTLASSTGVFLGANSLASQLFSGYLGGLRITKGVARYKTGFPPLIAAWPAL